MSKKFSYYTKNKDGVDVEYCWYNSSNVIYSECLDPDNDFKTLKIVFSNGTQYEYKKVDTTDYLIFREDASQGKALNRLIKNKKYEYVKLENADINKINEEYESLVEDGLYVENKEDGFEIRNNDNDVIYKSSKKLDDEFFDMVKDILKVAGVNIKKNKNE